MKPDYYKLLKVAPDASVPKITKAYVTVRDPFYSMGSLGTQELLDELRDAYLVLSDPVERSRYDAVRERRLNKLTQIAKSIYLSVRPHFEFLDFARQARAFQRTLDAGDMMLEEGHKADFYERLGRGIQTEIDRLSGLVESRKMDFGDFMDLAFQLQRVEVQTNNLGIGLRELEALIK